MQDVFDIIHTTRAMRRLKPDPVPDDLVRKILEAGVAAANGGNSQRWRFLVIKDTAVKKAVQVWYKMRWSARATPTRRRPRASRPRNTPASTTPWNT